MKYIVIGLAVVIAVLFSCLIISRADEEMIEIIRKADEEETEWDEWNN